LGNIEDIKIKDSKNAYIEGLYGNVLVKIKVLIVANRDPMWLDGSVKAALRCLMIVGVNDKDITILGVTKYYIRSFKTISINELGIRDNVVKTAAPRYLRKSTGLL
jgi:hypothetical protein